MQVEQYVMAYGIEQDRIRAIIPEDLFLCVRFSESMQRSRTTVMVIWNLTHR